MLPKPMYTGGGPAAPCGGQAAKKSSSAGGKGWGACGNQQKPARVCWAGQSAGRGTSAELNAYTNGTRRVSKSAIREVSGGKPNVRVRHAFTTPRHGSHSAHSTNRCVSELKNCGARPGHNALGKCRVRVSGCANSATHGMFNFSAIDAHHSVGKLITSTSADWQACQAVWSICA